MNNRGGGLTVSCVLPRSRSAESARVSAGQADTARERKSRRIFIIDESPVVRQGLMQIIGSREDFQVCGEARNSDEAIRQIARTSPDLVIIDIAIEGVGGIDLIKALKSRYPALEILVLSDHDESMYAERSLRAGAGGYIMKREASQAVLQALITVIEGRQYLSDRMKEEILGKISRANPDKGIGVEKLSNREFEIFQLIGKGLGNRNIAEKMNISVKTVENYRERIKSKLNIDNSQTLVQFAVQWLIKRPS
ncbi:MAG: DNA-binding response regulator [Candidatus Melainabacteria bacterium HGW-Melainabacteria-1]|nr:MAG: DNA-binding response regulator [Candidatus Melainabacteria bacterium HGW-Melainabacteria-1]